jgi:Zn-dependent protease with chaperone function
MTLLLIGPIAVGVLALLPSALTRLGRIINAPEAIATGFVVSLLGWAIVPAAWVLCSVGSVVDLTAHRELTDFGCALGLGAAPWDLSGYLLAAAVIIPIGVALIGHQRRRDATLDLAQMTVIGHYSSPLGSGVAIVSSNDIHAVSAGLVHPRALVTTGTLALLSDQERQAVFEHEAAHLRLGHTRLLELASGIAALYWFIPPVRNAWNGLRRELEVAADHEARRIIGAPVIMTALAKVVTRQARLADAHFGAPDDVRYRIRRLQEPTPTPGGQLLAMGAAVIAPSTLVALASCVLTANQILSPSLFSCALVLSLVLGVLGWRRLAAPWSFTKSARTA